MGEISFYRTAKNEKSAQKIKRLLQQAGCANVTIYMANSQRAFRITAVAPNHQVNVKVAMLESRNDYKNLLLH